jgi:hypothetical protein
MATKAERCIFHRMVIKPRSRHDRRSNHADGRLHDEDPLQFLRMSSRTALLTATRMLSAGIVFKADL